MRPVRTLLKQEKTGLFTQDVNEQQLAVPVALLERLAQTDMAAEYVVRLCCVSESVRTLRMLLPFSQNLNGFLKDEVVESGFFNQLLASDEHDFKVTRRSNLITQVGAENFGQLCREIFHLIEQLGLSVDSISA